MGTQSGNSLIIPSVTAIAQSESVLPKLWGNRVDNIPFTDPQYTHPKLCPMWPVDRSSKFMQCSSCLDHPRILCRRTQDPHCSINHCRSEDGTLSFNMQSPSSLFRMLACEEVVLDFGTVGWRNLCLGHVPGNDNAWQLKQWASILTAPVARRELKVGEE